MDADTDVFGLSHLSGGKSDEAGNMSNSQARDKSDAESGSVGAETEDNQENVHRLKRTGFVLLITCILLGSCLLETAGGCLPQKCQADGCRRIPISFATLTPVITDEFHSLNDLGWYQIA